MDNRISLLHVPRHFLQRLAANLKSSSSTPLLAGLAASTTTIALVATWLISDYRDWKNFGTGGTPPTPAGYWRMTKIRIIRAFTFNDGLRDHSKIPIPETGSGRTRFLKIELPDRTRARPRIQARPMPQRQHAVSLDYDSKSRLFSLPEKFTYSHPQHLYLDLSATEGRSTDAIYAYNPSSAAQDMVLKNEIAHVHPAENSLHVWLSEADARAVVEKGWGERFPLSAMGLCHAGWTFVYAPESMDDVDVVEEIVKAGCAFVSGERIR